MPRVTFHATRERDTWRHKPHHENGAVVVTAQHGDTTTTKIRGDGRLRDGDSISMTPFEAEWCEQHYPDNFTVTDEAIDPEDYTRPALDKMAETRDPDYDPSDYSTKADVADFLNTGESNE